MGNTDVFPEKCPKQAFSQRYIPDRWASIHMSLCPAAPPPPAKGHVLQYVLRSFFHLISILCRCSSYEAISFISRVCFSTEIHPGKHYTAPLGPHS